MLLRAFILLTCLTFAATVNEATEPSLGQTFKKIFATPTPTPHRKKKTAAATKKKSPTPTPSPKTTPSPTATAKKKTSALPTPSPRRKKKPSPSASPTETPSPTPAPSASPHRKKKGSPTTQPFEPPSPSESPSPTPAESPSQSASPSVTPRRGATNASLSPEQIKGFESYPENVKKFLSTALELTTRNLTYKYGSADPNSGGMDCSGFVYFVLKQNGVTDVPRDSSEQYVWLRRARQFESVLREKDDSFGLEDLKPGDLLFWRGTFSIRRRPPITHAMIYLGREKKTGRRVMVGASDGRVYQGESRYGVSVFDFNIPRRDKNGDGKLQPSFVGYGHIPGLHD